MSPKCAYGGGGVTGLGLGPKKYPFLRPSLTNFPSQNDRETQQFSLQLLSTHTEQQHQLFPEISLHKVSFREILYFWLRREPLTITNGPNFQVEWKNTIHISSAGYSFETSPLPSAIAETCGTEFCIRGTSIKK